MEQKDGPVAENLAKMFLQSRASAICHVCAAEQNAGSSQSNNRPVTYRDLTVILENPHHGGIRGQANDGQQAQCCQRDISAFGEKIPQSQDKLFRPAMMTGQD
ncbi:unnamed protein product [Notodromas monacha]|uniref:Uncharacterized protein n=1 Tax=Notodromas monacha TaxID=399045 RepID=A0A7R9BNR4_9CRUS|nr:unnamed protein product [Notodromas monacha]CAG0917522.1 unnamed protein product [Notodromas monacha]